MLIAYDILLLIHRNRYWK